MKQKTTKQKKSTNAIRLMIIALLVLGAAGGVYAWQYFAKTAAINSQTVRSETAIQQYKGRFLLLNGDQNQVWYIYPGNNQRFYLGNAERGLAVMRRLGKEVGAAELAKLPIADSGTIGDANYQRQMAGYVVTNNKGFWYVHPQNLMRYYLNSAEDFNHLVSRFGVSITTENLTAITLATSFPSTAANPPAASPAASRSYQYKTIQTKRGVFTIDLMTIDLKYNQILTATAAKADCYNNCPARPLADYVKALGGFAGVHGAYFCPPDYSWCGEKKNYYFFPFYETSTGFLVNAGQVKWLQGSILVFDQNNNYYFFVDGVQFVGVAEFEEKYNVKIKALASNAPALIANGVNIVNSQNMDDKQRNAKGTRGALGVKGTVVYSVIARGATVPDMASVMEALGVTTALNLDGGGSAALFWNGAYKVGPGRSLPTAIIFKAK